MVYRIELLKQSIFVKALCIINWVSCSSFQSMYKLKKTNIVFTWYELWPTYYLVSIDRVGIGVEYSSTYKLGELGYLISLMSITSLLEFFSTRQRKKKLASAGLAVDSFILNFEFRG